MKGCFQLFTAFFSSALDDSAEMITQTEQWKRAFIYQDETLEG